MPGLLTADMAREGLRPLIQRADKPKLTHAEVSEFLEGADFVAAFIQSYWQHAQSLINRGGERRTIGATFKDLAVWIDDCVLAYRKVRADAQKLNFADCDLADLDKTVQALETIKDTVASEVD